MTIEGYRKVHIVMPGLEVIRVIKPLQQIGCEKLIIIGDPKKTKRDEKLYYEYNNEIKRQLRDTLEPEDISHVDIDIFDIEVLLSNLCRVIKEEKQVKNLVFVNVSCGSKVFVSAAVMASMMYDAIPYFVKRKGFRTKPKDLEKNGRPAGIAIDVEEPIEIPTFKLQSPEPELVTILSIIETHPKKIVRQGDIIKELETRGVMEDVYDVEKSTTKKGTEMGKRKIRRKALNEFKTAFFKRLLQENWVITKGYGRRVEVRITKRGRQMLRIFSYLIIN